MSIAYSSSTSASASLASSLTSSYGIGIDVETLISASTSDMQTQINNLYTKENTLYNSQSELSSVKSLFSSLKSSIQRLTDGNITKNLDLFSAKTTTTSKESLVKASATNSTVAQSLKVKVNNLATSTVATGTTNPVVLINEDTKFTDLNDRTASAGTFSFYVNNTKYQFEIESSDTLGNIVDDINSQLESQGVTASVDSSTGKFLLDIDNDLVTDFRLGASDDDSTFISSLHLSKVAIDAGQEISSTNIDKIESNASIYEVNKSGLLIGNGANLTTEVTAGTFTIGAAEFSIDSSTTLDSLIYQINQNAESGVVASIDSTTGKLILTSTDQGECTINVQSGPCTTDDEADTGKVASNFLEVMGLVNTDGSITSGSQVLGKNASVEINGRTVESYSNTITADVSGIKGLTLTLGEMPTDEDETTTVNINVKNDTSQVTSAISSFISAFNKVINTVDTDTASGADLYGETSLVMIRNILRNAITDSVDGLSTYNCLGLVGVSTGKAGTSVSEDTDGLEFDQTAFAEALNNNPDAVRTLFLGDDSKGVTGVMENLLEKVSSALDYENGYFTARNESYTNQIKSIDTQIIRKTNALTAYQSQLKTKFTSMNTYISKLQSSASGLFG